MNPMSNSAAIADAHDAAPGRRKFGVVWVASIIVLSIAAGSAKAQPAPNFEGRWRDASSNVMLDISRCAAGWCGFAVEYDKCGGQKLTLAVKTSGLAEGTYDLAGAGLNYPVQAGWREGKLMVADNAQGNMAIARRSASPIILTLTRIGAAVCGARPAS
jgi:hypothetical protein